MKLRSLSLLLLGVLCAGSLHADDQTRDVQAELKNQGFYFGEVDGQPGASTTGALRRFQIRNGLEVTGEVNPQVLQSLGIGGGSPSPAPQQIAPEPVTPPAAARTARPPANLRRDESVTESDRRALEQEEPRSRTAPPGNQPGEQYRGVFGGSPYASAPRVVQEETFLRAQKVLSQRGFLPEVDGRPGPATEEAIVRYQRSLRLPTSGRLDLETLSVMRLLPGVGPASARPRAELPTGPGTGRVAPPRAYKGIWVQ